jgi:hypothetical protein
MLQSSICLDSIKQCLGALYMKGFLSSFPGVDRRWRKTEITRIYTPVKFFSLSQDEMVPT